ncbi:transposase [Haloferula helveola]|uniref:Transposase n=1 Tax=Haloferula helveola TaxID=490095 RepID=A0ABM7R7T3_9BACT|nr:transposase [Haloferula helveola]
MARQARYEAAGAVYHVMARGDGGRDVFEDDRDRLKWLDRMAEVCGKYGWRVHAYVLMGNHFHLLLETPQPNLVSGMKWLMGVHSQDWNRKRKRRGHVYQGRYKAVVVNGEDGAGYFRIVADYIHLNPVRSGWVGGTTGKPLAEWRWSSFPYYGRRKAPAWLATEKVLGAFELSPERRGRRAYAGYLEERARDREGALNDESLRFLRRGWYLGDEGFRDRLVDALADGIRPKRRKGSVSGGAARAHDEAEAERIVRCGWIELGIPSEPGNLAGRGAFRDEKALLAWLSRKLTSVSRDWVAERLAMGHPTSVSRAAARVRVEPDLAKRGRKLERAVVQQITD